MTFLEKMENVIGKTHFLV